MKSILGALALSTALSASPALAESAKVIQNTHDDIIKVCNDPDFGKYIVNSKGSICDEYSPDGGKNWFSIKTVGGASVLALSLWAVVRIRKTKREKEKIADAELGDDEWQTPMEAFEVDKGNSGEIVFPDDVPSDEEVFPTDPIQEADVYMAYGRYADAENILKNAIKKNPDKIETYTKLLELYYKTENIAGFQEIFMHDDAIHMMNNVPQDDLVEMRTWGRKIDPENPIYTELGTPTKIVIPIEESSTVQETIDLGPDTIIPEAEELTPEIVTPSEELVIAHEEINPHLITVSENIFPTKIAEHENISMKAKPIMPGMDKPLLRQLERRGFEVIKKEELGEIHIKVIREGSELRIFNKEGELTETKKLLDTYIINDTILNTFLDLKEKTPRIRLEEKNGVTRYIEITGKAVFE